MVYSIVHVEQIDVQYFQIKVKGSARRFLFLLPDNWSDQASVVVFVCPYIVLHTYHDCRGEEFYGV